MSGVFVCVVGPSGAGKDTLIDGARRALASDDRFSFPRRIVTRQSTSAEDHDTISPEAFRQMQGEDRFALCWSAHGLGYAIPGDAIESLGRHCVVVCNLSRSAIADARQRFETVRVVLVVAPKAVLRERLLGRGREDAAAVDARLEREAIRAPGDVDLVIENIGDVHAHIATLVGLLRGLAGDRTGRAVATERHPS